MILSLPLSLISIILPVVFADVEFTYPPAGAQIPATVGTINVQWKESGRAPPISLLTEYTLDLMVGGNEEADMFQVVAFKAGGFFSTGNNVTNSIAAGISGPCPNGFFFRMSSNTATGGKVVDYSSRFTITGLTGSLDSKYYNAAQALNGNTSPPPRSGNALPANPSSSSLAIASSTQLQATVTVTTGQAVGSTGPAKTPDSAHQQSNNGVLVGVGVAVALFITALIGLGVWIFMRRRRRRRVEDPFDDKNALGKQPSVTTLSELSNEGRVVFVEAGDGQPPPEMDGNQIRAELPGDYVYEGGDLGTGGVPLTPIASSINGEETLDPMVPLSKI